MVELLLKNNANVNDADSSGYTPLHWSVIENNLEIGKLLLDKGADVKTVNNHNYDPFMLAIALNNMTFFKILLNHIGKKESCKHQQLHLNTAVRFGRCNFVKLLIDQGANINQRGEDGETPLHTGLTHQK